MAVGFPQNPFDRKQFVVEKKVFEYNSELGTWNVGTKGHVSANTGTVADVNDLSDTNSILANAGRTLPVYATEADLLSVNIDTIRDGQMAFVTATNKVHIFYNQKWFGAPTSAFTPPPPEPSIGAYTTSRIDSASTDLSGNSANSKARIRTVMLNDNRFITAWVDDNYVQYAIGGKIDGETVTVGTAIEINPGKTGASLSLATDGEVAVCIYEDRYPYYSITPVDSQERSQERWSFARVIGFTTTDGLTLQRGSTIQTCENPVSNTPNRGVTPDIQWASGNNWVYISGYWSRVGGDLRAVYGSFTRSGLTLTAARSVTVNTIEPLMAWTFSEYDPVNNKFLVAYRVSSGQYRTQMYTVTPSTGNVSVGSTTNPDTAISQTGLSMDNVDIPYDASLGQWVFVYNRNGTYLLTVDGSSFTESFGTEHTILSSGTVTSTAGRTSAYYHAASGTIRIFCRKNSSADLALLPITVNSATTVTFDVSTAWTVDTGGGAPAASIAYNATAGGGVAYRYDSGIKVAAFIEP